MDRITETSGLRGSFGLPTVAGIALGSKRLSNRRSRRGGEFGVVHWNILLNLFDLYGESVSGARQRPAKRYLHSIRVAIVRIVDLRWVIAERGFRIPD